MSATTEMLLEQIETLTKEIKLDEASGSDVTQKRDRLRDLHGKLIVANRSLNEGLNVLKD